MTTYRKLSYCLSLLLAALFCCAVCFGRNRPYAINLYKTDYNAGNKNRSIAQDGKTARAEGSGFLSTTEVRAILPYGGRDYNTVDMSRQRMFNGYMYIYA